MKVLNKMVKEFSSFEEVEAILLAGSKINETDDEHSDYDLYVYCNKEIPIQKRKKIAATHFKYIELNNQFWETEDDGLLMANGIPVEIIYRDLKWIDAQLERTVLNCEADIGYTTCLWSNFISSKILYDKANIATELQQKYTVQYPETLKLNIIKKNYPLLRKSMTAYSFQIEKALKRRDCMSVNHRIAAFLASYMDILFAMNEMPHPGEKKLVKILTEKERKTPMNMEDDLNYLMKNISSFDEKVLMPSLHRLIDRLDQFLREEDIDLIR